MFCSLEQIPYDHKYHMIKTKRLTIKKAKDPASDDLPSAAIFVESHLNQFSPITTYSPRFLHAPTTPQPGCLSKRARESKDSFRKRNVSMKQLLILDLIPTLPRSIPVIISGVTKGLCASLGTSPQTNMATVTMEYSIQSDVVKKFTQ